MAKIGPIFSIILPATTTVFQPDVFLVSPLCLYPFGYLSDGGAWYIKFGAGFGSSSITNKTYSGLLAGKIETNVFNFSFELYFTEVPVLPATSYPSILAKFAVP